MSKIFRDLVEYNNVSTNNCMKNIENFRQSNLDYVFSIPVQKPDIEQLVKVWANPCIINQKILKTPKGISLEGQKVTGHKCLIEGEINLKIEYVALQAEQSLHIAHINIPFCSYVVMPEHFDENYLFTTSILIEDISSNIIDCRNIYNNITYMTIVDIC